MSEDLKKDILQILQSQKQNTADNNIIRATELRQPQQSVYCSQSDNFHKPQVLIENAESDSDSER